MDPTTWNTYINRDVVFYKIGESSTSPPIKVPEPDSGPIINYDDEREALVVNLPPQIPKWY